MDQQGKHTKSDSLDFSDFPSFEDLDLCYNKDIAWPGSMTHVNENHLKTQEKIQEKPTGASMEEEMKIRHELEIDIEKDLEEEIKEGIYHLALRLHRLYQQQNQRKKREASDHGGKYLKEETISEVIINIKMEGGTKIEIKENVKDNQTPQKKSSSSRSVDRSTIKKFDWVNSLRSSAATSGPVLMSKKNGSQENMMKSRMNNSRHFKGSLGKDNECSLELGWKY